MKRTQRSFNSTIAKSAPPKKTNPARRRKAFALAYHSKEYVEWIHQQPCVACGIIGYSECAHVGRFSGMGRKGSWRETVPLCGLHPPRRTDATSGLIGCHDEYHTYGWRTFEDDWQIDLSLCASLTHAAWLSSCGAPGGQT